MIGDRRGAGALAAGGLAAVLASACCLGPLVLVSVGLGGAWLSNLQVLAPYQPIFIGVALVALFMAHRRIFRRAEQCEPGEVCALPRVKLAYQIVFWIFAGLVIVAFAFPYLAPYFY